MARQSSRVTERVCVRERLLLLSLLLWTAEAGLECERAIVDRKGADGVEGFVLGERNDVKRKRASQPVG